MRGIEQMQVIYEDNHLIAVNKPAGWLVQGDRTGDTPLSEYVKFYIKQRYRKPGDVFLGQIHRVDRPVSGVVLFARTSKALSRMNSLFRDREVIKTYLTITRVRPEPIEGTLQHYLLKDRKTNTTKAFVQLGRRSKLAKEAQLTYALLGALEGYYLIKIKPLTGRPHQIRAQLGEKGWPIVGDVKYGFDSRNRDGRIHLHSRKLEFLHPVRKQPVKIVAALPDEPLWNKFEEILAFSP